MEERIRHTTSAVLTELRLEGQLCDVVIKVDNVEFNAHKIILCGCSPYFRALFTGAWATSDKQTRTIPGVSPEMMQLIIQYAYTHSVPVTADNVVELLAAADQFLVSGIIQTCCFFLVDQLCPMNCIGIWMLIDFYYLPEMQHKVFPYVLHHFEEVVRVSQEFLELSVQQLAAIIENDQLNVRQESTVFEIVLRWINHLPGQRQGHLSELWPKVRLGLMTPLHLTKLMDNPMLKNSIELDTIIDAAMTAVMDFRTRSPKSVHSNLLNRPRLPSAILLVTGGSQDVFPNTGFEAYDVRANCWVNVKAARIIRNHHGAAVLNNVVYLIGGRSGGTHTNTVQKFDPITCTWRQVAPMNYCRCSVSVAVHNGCIYAIGGFSGQVYRNTVECYKPETDQWTMMAPMHMRRSGAGATTLNGKVYICGGIDGSRVLHSAECYNPDTNRWTMIAPMSVDRDGLGVAAYRGHIYAVGGYSSHSKSYLCTVEIYNPQTNRWHRGPSMCKPRRSFGIEVLDNQLFVVGGYDSSYMSSVECYDEEAGLWKSVRNINKPRCGLSCCVLQGLYQVAENLFPRGPLTFPNVEEAAGGSS